MQISWFREIMNKLELIKNSPKFLISKDTTKVTIKSMDENTEGKYFCEAFVIGDESTRHSLKRDVYILNVGKYL